MRLKLNTALWIIFLHVLSFNIFSINIDEYPGSSDKNLDTENTYNNVVYVRSGNSICTGSLINSRTVITAAHCLKSGSPVEVLFGADAEDPDLIIKATSFIANPEDNRYASFQGASYDVALISLETPVYSIAPLKLSTGTGSLNENVTIVGYGLHGSGLNPDQAFDGKKRLATNNLEIISKEEDLLGVSTESITEDKIILGYYFDNLSGESTEGSISLGDSGSPLLVLKENVLEILGIASWVRTDIINLNRGFGASAGYASIDENAVWIDKNNPLKNVSTIVDGNWEFLDTWNSDYIPNNFYNVKSGNVFNSTSARYYEIEVSNTISLSTEIELDRFQILVKEGKLNLLKDSSLKILDKAIVKLGSIGNKGTLTANSMSINAGTLSGTGSVNISNSLVLNSGNVIADGTLTANSMSINAGTLSGTGSVNISNSLVLNSGNVIADGTLTANSMSINAGTLSGTGSLTFKTPLTITKGTISPGNVSTPISTLNIVGDVFLHEDAYLEMSTRNDSSDYLKILGNLTIQGSLYLQPIKASERYSGNTSQILVQASNLSGTINNFYIDNDNIFGRLVHKIEYKDNSILWSLQNPVYEQIAISKLGKSIGKHIDSFSTQASKNFQTILNDLNYIDSNTQVSKSLEDLLPSFNSAEKIRLHDILSTNSIEHKGLFVERKNINANSKSSIQEGDLKLLTYNYKSLSSSVAKINGTYALGSSQENLKSDAYSMKYIKSLPNIKLSLGYSILKNKSLFQGNYTPNLTAYSRRMLSASDSKSFNFNILSTKEISDNKIKYGLRGSRGVLYTEASEEVLNEIKINSLMDKISFSTLKPFIGLERTKETKIGKFIFNGEISHRQFFIDDENVSFKLDKGDGFLQGANKLKINKAIHYSLGVVYISKSNIYLKAEIEKLDGFSTQSFSFGVLLN